MTIDLGALQTEARNPDTLDIDVISTHEMVKRIHKEDLVAAQAVDACLDVIAEFIDVVAPRIQAGGRLVYLGAGTSGRLGVLDASELPPTYSMPADKCIGLIAGGDRAIRNPVEGAEDSELAGENALKEIGLTKDDTVVGIASSGRTPYVLGALAYAKSIGCVTGGITCARPSEIEIQGNTDYVMAPVTGPEVVTGSTRMKAGTATKMVLNMISTGIMIRIGKTASNLMVDVKVSNYKLKLRARRIIRTLCGSSFYVVKDGQVTGKPIEVDSSPDGDKLIDDTIAACRQSVKLAIVVARTGLSVDQAALDLAEFDGVLSKVLERHNAALF
uniref:ARAD1C40172p n=1 Tax=Blastobotrys adeninivorans TaxID=409370 RepID=A0A060T3X2_BLAAD